MFTTSENCPGVKTTRCSKGIGVRKLTLLLLGTCLALHPWSSAGMDSRGNQFFGIKNFSNFKKSPGVQSNEWVLTSPPIKARIQFDELVASWNAEMTAADYLTIEVRAIYPEYETKYYVMGLWSADRALHPRESVLHQEDSDGDVDTDTFRLKRPADRFQIRLTMGGARSA